MQTRDNTIRVNKYLANHGIGARRNIEELLKQQTLTVNGKRVFKPGVRVNPNTDDIRFNGKKLEEPKLVYYILNKPKGIVSTVSDEFQRKNVRSFIKTKERIYPVGRLDKETKGLLLLTNDGELTNMLTHPKYHVPKTYQLTVKGIPSQKQLQTLQTGVSLADGITAPAEVKLVNANPKRSIINMTIYEGRNRQVRRMCENVRLPLIELERIQFGHIGKGNLKEGSYRQLSKDEIQSLKEAGEMK